MINYLPDYPYLQNSNLNKTVLSVAAERGDLPSVKLLLSHGARTDIDDPLHFWDTFSIQQPFGLSSQTQQVAIGE